MREDGGEECEVEEENDRCGHEKRRSGERVFAEREIVSLVYNIREEERMEGECNGIVLCECFVVSPGANYIKRVNCFMSSVDYEKGNSILYAYSFFFGVHVLV